LVLVTVLYLLIGLLKCYVEAPGVVNHVVDNLDGVPTYVDVYKPLLHHVVESTSPQATSF
jgi:hypothetical protein